MTAFPCPDCRSQGPTHSGACIYAVPADLGETRWCMGEDCADCTDENPAACGGEVCAKCDYRAADLGEPTTPEHERVYDWAHLPDTDRGNGWEQLKGGGYAARRREPICGVVSPNATPDGHPVACAWQPDHLPGSPHSWADLPTRAADQGETPRLTRESIEQLRDTVAEAPYEPTPPAPVPPADPGEPTESRGQ